MKELLNRLNELKRTLAKNQERLAQINLDRDQAGSRENLARGRVGSAQGDLHRALSPEEVATATERLVTEQENLRNTQQLANNLDEEIRRLTELLPKIVMKIREAEAAVWIAQGDEYAKQARQAVAAVYRAYAAYTAAEPRDFNMCIGYIFGRPSNEDMQRIQAELRGSLGLAG